MIRYGDVTAALTDGYHTGSEMLFPCLPHYHDISEAETNCIILYSLIWQLDKNGSFNIFNIPSRSGGCIPH